MKKPLLFLLMLAIQFGVFASASLKITFSGTNAYVVNIGGSKHFVDNQYLQLDYLTEGLYSVKFSVRQGMSTFLVHQTDIYLPDHTETIGIFENNVLKIKSVNQSGNVGAGNSWNTHNHLTDAEFEEVIEAVDKESFDDQKRQKMISLVRQGMISSTQAKQLLALFSFDSERYEAAIAIEPYVYDRQNLYKLADAFSFNGTRDDFLAYINELPVSNTGNNNFANSGSGNYMDVSGFNQLLKNIEDESFDSKKSNLILSSIKHTKITTRQAIAILETFSFDSYRLEAANKMIPYIWDPENYWQAGDTFSFNSNKEKFLKNL